MATKKQTKQAEQTMSKIQMYRQHLKTITNGLVEMATAAGRADYTRNQLLRECYQVVDKELKTFEEWKAQGARVRRGEHAYLFWGAPVTTENGTFYPVVFKFTNEQVVVNNK